MYIVYLLREKQSGEVIYVGSSARPITRLNEHQQALNGIKPPSKVHQYMLSHNLTLYKDVEVVFTDVGKNKAEMVALEEQYYYKYAETLLNDRPGENRYGWYNPKRRSVRCVNDGKVFQTISACSHYYKKARTTIQNVTGGHKPYTWINGEKYFFEYADKARKCND